MKTSAPQDAKPIYVDPMTDFGFKRIFGNANVLRNFLNAIFEKEGKVITSVRYKDKEIVPRRRDEKTIIYDVFCEVNGGESFILEMQRCRQDTFRERALYYMSRSVSDQGRRGGDWQYELQPVVGIFIMDFHLEENVTPKQVVEEVTLYNLEEQRRYSDKWRMFFVDLKAFKLQKEGECESNLDQWIYNIKHMGSMTKAPKMASEEKLLELYATAEIDGLTERQRRDYERALRHHRDRLMDETTRRNEMIRSTTKAREEGLAEGHAVGLAEGREVGREEGASEERRRWILKQAQEIRDMLKIGLSLEQIATVKRLTVDEITDIAADSARL